MMLALILAAAFIFWLLLPMPERRRGVTSETSVSAIRTSRARTSTRAHRSASVAVMATGTTSA